MDFTVIEKSNRDDICYKLLKANFYRDYYVIIAQDKNDLACGSFKATREGAIFFFNEIAESKTDVHTLFDIISDYQKESVESI